MISSSASVNPAVCVYHDSAQPFLVECLRKRKSRAPRQHQLPHEEGTNIMSALLCRRNPKSEAKFHAQQHPLHGRFEVTQLIILEGERGNLVHQNFCSSSSAHSVAVLHVSSVFRVWWATAIYSVCRVPLISPALGSCKSLGYPQKESQNHMWWGEGGLIGSIWVTVR